MDNSISKHKNPKNPKQLRSPATIKSSAVIAELSTLTGIDKQDIDRLFKTFAAVAINYQLDGYNLAMPYIGVLKIVKQYIPATYNKEILKKYDAVAIDEFKSGKKFTVLFSPMLKLSPNFRLQITDTLPTNLQAHRLERLPFENGFKKYDFKSQLISDDTDADNS